MDTLRSHILELRQAINWLQRAAVEDQQQCQWSSSPVFITRLMTEANCPLSKELSSLTVRTRQVHSTRRDDAKRISPTTRSDRFTATKRWTPRRTSRLAVSAVKEDSLPLMIHLLIQHTYIS